MTDLDLKAELLQAMGHTGVTDLDLCPDHGSCPTFSSQLMDRMALHLDDLEEKRLLLRTLHGLTTFPKPAAVQEDDVSDVCFDFEVNLNPSHYDAFRERDEPICEDSVEKVEKVKRRVTREELNDIKLRLDPYLERFVLEEIDDETDSETEESEVAEEEEVEFVDEEDAMLKEVEALVLQYGADDLLVKELRKCLEGNERCLGIDANAEEENDSGMKAALTKEILSKMKL